MRTRIGIKSPHGYGNRPEPRPDDSEALPQGPWACPEPGGADGVAGVAAPGTRVRPEGAIDGCGAKRPERSGLRCGQCRGTVA